MDEIDHPQDRIGCLLEIETENMKQNKSIQNLKARELGRKDWSTRQEASSSRSGAVGVLRQSE